MSGEQPGNEPAEPRGRHRSRLSPGAANERIVRRAPVRPREGRREAFRAVLVVTKSSSARPPRLPAEQPVEPGAIGVVQEEEVDLMRVFVLDDAPGRPPSAKERRVDPDLALGGRAG